METTAPSYSARGAPSALEDYFYTLAEFVSSRLNADEAHTTEFLGEESDFVRFNNGRVRQAGHVRHYALRLDLIAGRRHTSAHLDLSGVRSIDTARIETELGVLRTLREVLPEDPYLDYSQDVRHSRMLTPAALPTCRAAVQAITTAAAGLDLVGIYAAGPVYRGFANSLGQRNWHEYPYYSFDFSLYEAGTRAVKTCLAGTEWSQAIVQDKLERARAELAVLARPPRTLTPGRYPAYLAPAALGEILGVIAWNGFGVKSHRTCQTPLLGMLRGDQQLSPSIHLAEHHAAGIAPHFTPAGYIKPDSVPLVSAGAYQECLVAARSAREYGLGVNAATESPEALELGAGNVPLDDAASTLGEGLYINNLWYCNVSDLASCRITGMTRYACFWVEGGRIAAPIPAMRFDESLYHLLGDRLTGLTREREHLIDPDTYERRATSTMLLPGVLNSGFTLTL